MKEDNEIIESLVAEGVIGASLGALVSVHNCTTGVLAYTAILASYKAYKRAQQTGIALIMKEGNTLYQFNIDGTKVLLKNLPIYQVIIPEKFTIQ